MNSKSLFIKTIKGIACHRPPVWFMRQAGRVLPSYLELRKKHSFHELMQNPELAAKVTLLPVHDFGVDAAILFSDILVVPEALEMDLQYTDQGPVFKNPIYNNLGAINKLKPNTNKLLPIYKTIEIIKKTKPDDIALIGFCGAPFTTFCYMIQGNSFNNKFPEAILFFYNNKSETLKLFEIITEISIEYAVNQIKSGIDAFQIFETHADLIPYQLYIEIVLPYVKKIASAVKETGCPIIFFPKGLGMGLQFINPDIADYIGIDWQNSLFDVRKYIDQSIGLQGNLDPRIFSATNTDFLISQLESFKTFGTLNHKWIFNTGHGLLPSNLFRNIKFTVDWIKTTNWQRP